MYNIENVILQSWNKLIFFHLSVWYYFTLLQGLMFVPIILQTKLLAHQYLVLSVNPFS